MTATTRHERIGKRIKERREELHMSRQKLGEATNVTATYIGEIERGKKVPAPERLDTIVSVLKTTLEELMENIEMDDLASDPERPHDAKTPVMPVSEGLPKNGTAAPGLLPSTSAPGSLAVLITDALADYADTHGLNVRQAVALARLHATAAAATPADVDAGRYWKRLHEAVQAYTSSQERRALPSLETARV